MRAPADDIRQIDFFSHLGLLIRRLIQRTSAGGGADLRAPVQKREIDDVAGSLKDSFWMRIEVNVQFQRERVGRERQRRGA